MNSESVDLATDPPFNKGRDSMPSSFRTGSWERDVLGWTRSRTTIPGSSRALAFRRHGSVPWPSGCLPCAVYKPTGSIYLHLRPLTEGRHGCTGGKTRNRLVLPGGASKLASPESTTSKDERRAPSTPLKSTYGETGGGQGGAVKYYRDNKGTYSIVNARDWWECCLLHTGSVRIRHRTPSRTLRAHD